MNACRAGVDPPPSTPSGWVGPGLGATATRRWEAGPNGALFLGGDGDLAASIVRRGRDGERVVLHVYAPDREILATELMDDAEAAKDAALAVVDDPPVCDRDPRSYHTTSLCRGRWVADTRCASCWGVGEGVV